MGLVFYHGWTQAQIAAFFQTSERTIRRRWQSACLKLDQMVKELIYPRGNRFMADAELLIAGEKNEQH